MSTDTEVDPVDLYIGKRLYRRRRICALTQAELAAVLGVRPQQVQKYECGGSRISASRLFAISKALTVPIGYFTDGFEGAVTQAPANDTDDDGDVSPKKEDLSLAVAFSRLSPGNRRRLLRIAEVLEDESRKSGKNVVTALKAA